MENEEPNYIVPRPFPLDSSELLEKSVSLDLTPERPPVQRSRLKKNKSKYRYHYNLYFCQINLYPHTYPDWYISEHSERKKCETSHDSDLTTPLLSAPQLNSTAHLFNRLCTLKQAQETHPSCSDREIVRSNDDIIPPSGGIRRDLSDPGPLKVSSSNWMLQWCLQWNLWIKDTLGPAVLSTIERLSLSSEVYFYRKWSFWTL